MSRSIDLFIDADQPPDELAAALGRVLGSDLEKDSATGAWVLRQGDVHAGLTEHPFADDEDLPFTRFRYSLSARVANTVRPQDAPATVLLRRIADLTQRQLGLPVLLVMDLQYRDQPAETAREGDGAAGDGDGAPGEGDVAAGEGDVAAARDDPMMGDASGAAALGDGQ
jgi:hypothetical protein